MALETSLDPQNLIDTMSQSPGLRWAFRRLLYNHCLLDVVISSHMHCQSKCNFCHSCLKSKRNCLKSLIIDSYTNLLRISPSCVRHRMSTRRPASRAHQARREAVYRPLLSLLSALAAEAPAAPLLAASLSDDPERSEAGAPAGGAAGGSSGGAAAAAAAAGEPGSVLRLLQGLELQARRPGGSCVSSPLPRSTF